VEDSARARRPAPRAFAAGTYDVAVITKDAEGKVHVEKHEKPTQHGARGGIAVGALVGVLFPPSVIGAAAVGGLVGGVGGHLKKGMSRGDAKELGDLLESGQAALIVIGESRVEEELDKALTRAEKSPERRSTPTARSSSGSSRRPKRRRPRVSRAAARRPTSRAGAIAAAVAPIVGGLS
jgi:hypothetical protein